MMDHASRRSFHLVAGVICLFGVLLPASPRAAAQEWAPVVAKAGHSDPLLQASSPPLPHPKPAALRNLAAVAAQPPVFAAPAGTSDITTGSIDALEPNTVLPTIEAARLIADDGDVPADALITGTADGPGSDLARGYCANIAGTAAEARLALQQVKLAETEKAIGYRLTALETKTAEYKAWVERRDQFLKRATDTLVKIYTQMEPDAASQQLAALDEETAAALLVKLEPQYASSILNEMAPEKAARLTATISGAARTQRPNGPPAGAAVAPSNGAVPQRADPREGRS